MSKESTESQPEPLLVDTKGLCAMTGFSRQRINAIRKDPSMAFPPALVVGRSVRFRVEDLKRWLDALAGGAPALAALAAERVAGNPIKAVSPVVRSILLKPSPRPTVALVEEQNRRVLAIPPHPGVVRAGRMVKTKEGGEVLSHKRIALKSQPPAPTKRFEVELRTRRILPPPVIHAPEGPKIDLSGSPNAEKLALLRADYEGGKSLDALCAENKVGKSRLSKLLRSAGAAMRSPGRKKVVADGD
jgi:hypothetical protein